MSTFTAIQHKYGVRYMKDKKFVKKADIPEDVLNQLEVGKQINSDGEVIPEPVKHACIFCGQYGNRERLVNNQIVAMCEEDFYSQSLGKVAEQLRNQENHNG